MKNEKLNNNEIPDLTDRVMDNIANLDNWGKDLIFSTNISDKDRFLKITKDIYNEYNIIKSNDSFFKNLYDNEIKGLNSSYPDYKLVLFSMMHYLQLITKNNSEYVDLVIQLRKEKENKR